MPFLDLRARHRAIADVMFGLGLFHLVHDRAADFCRYFVRLSLDRVGAVVSGTAFDHINRRVRDQRKHVAGFLADILDPLVAGRMVYNLAERLFEFGI